MESVLISLFIFRVVFLYLVCFRHDSCRINNTVVVYTTCCFPEQTIYNHNDTNYYTPVTLDLPKTSTTQRNRIANWYGRIIVLKDFKADSLDPPQVISENRLYTTHSLRRNLVWT
jgi:hypothetical protein